MKALNPYLNFNGKTEEAFNHYKKVFGGAFATFMRFKDMPKNPSGNEGCEEAEPNGEDGNLIMHVALPIGANMLMGSDVPGNMPQAETGTNISLSFHAESREDADRIFAGLAEGGAALMPMADMFWGDYWGMVQDAYGIHWMISFNTMQQQ